MKQLENRVWNKIKFIFFGYAIIFASLFVLQLIIYIAKFLIEKTSFGDFSLLLPGIFKSTALLSVLIAAILLIPVMLKKR